MSNKKFWIKSEHTILQNQERGAENETKDETTVS